MCKKVKIESIETGFIVKRSGDQAHFHTLAEALYFASLLLSPGRVSYTFGQLLDAIRENTVEKLEINLTKAKTAGR